MKNSIHSEGKAVIADKTRQVLPAGLRFVWTYARLIFNVRDVFAFAVLFPSR